MPSNSPETSEQYDLDCPHRHSGEPSLLRLLRKSGENGLIDGELRRELEELFALLYRIDQLIERTEQSVTPEEEDQKETDPPPDESSQDPLAQPVSENQIYIDERIISFDPAEFSRPPLAASLFGRPATEPVAAHRPSPASSIPGHPSHAESNLAPIAHDPETRQTTNRCAHQTFHDAGDEQQECWWVNFNGDVSLDRLARLREILSESPFTIETRFDEISEGLIILRVETDRELTAAHVEWIVGQVMASVGLNRNAAILSSRKEKSGGHRWASTAIS